MFYKRVIFWKQGLHQRTENFPSVQVFWARLASFDQLGLISDPQIPSKLQNGINDPKGLENKIYTVMKGRETFYRDHTVPITSCKACSCGHFFLGITCLKQPHNLGPLNKNTVQMNLYLGVTCLKQPIFVLPLGSLLIQV